MKFDALLRAHEFMNIERPPKIWEADTEDDRLLPLLGEMIASGLAKGAELASLTLSAANIVVEKPVDEEDEPEPGEYVALTVRGAGDWGPDGTWPAAGAPRSPWLDHMNERLQIAGAVYAYVRNFASDSSVTIFLRRR